jgi:hypothetical protein
MRASYFSLFYRFYLFCSSFFLSFYLRAPRRTSSLPPPQPPRSAGATPAAACPFSPHPMRALARAASLLRRAAGSAPTTAALHHPSPGVGPFLAKVWSPLCPPSPVLGAAVRRRLALHGGADGGLSLLAASVGY